MKILFIIPPNIHYIEPYAYVEADKSNTIRPYLGILYLAAMLRRELGISAKIIDAPAEQLDVDQIGKIIEAEDPDLVGFSVLTFNILNCIEVCKKIKNIRPELKICFGGWHPTLYPAETLSLGWPDYVVIGEGEQTFLELVKAHMDNAISEESIKRIKGIGFVSKNGETVITPFRQPLRNLDDLPFPAYDLVDTSKYSNLLACTGNLVTIMTSRGCPHKCAFCDMRRTPYRFRSAANVLEEIKHWTDQGAQEFFIQDDNFTMSRKRLIEFCRLVAASGLDIKYKISSRVDYLDDELVKLLKQSGCHRIYFGVESGSQKILDFLEKGITIDQIHKAFNITKKHGIDRCAYIMIGSYPESEFDINETLQLIKKIRPEHLHCSICTPMPKTKMYHRLMEERVIKKDYWLEFAKFPNSEFKTPFLSQYFDSTELRKMQNRIQRNFYLSPTVIFREMKKTKDVKQFFVKTKMAFRVFTK